ncbi:hypothetical protein QJQ45_027072 [Haematococcus lacustris]|nr:hypothetical protein QJQ45_027072 [Haematococcus lacustris]
MAGDNSANTLRIQLNRYITELSIEEQDEVLSKFAAAGFTGAYAKLVPRLGNEELSNIGIQPQVVRSVLMNAFSEDGGLSKTIVLEDDTGAQEELLFYKPDFDTWVQYNILTQLLPNGINVVVASWDYLEEGGRYFTERSLPKPVSDMEWFQSTQFKTLEDEVAESALTDMLQYHPESLRLSVNEVKNKNGQSRYFDGIIVAANCVKVVESAWTASLHGRNCCTAHHDTWCMQVKSVVDVSFAIKLQSVIEFMWQAAKEGAPDLHFARRPDGSVKDIKGALGGLHMVAGDQNQEALLQIISKCLLFVPALQEQYDLYLPDGKRFSNVMACHPMQNSPAHC